jgi:hypothetical protein
MQKLLIIATILVFGVACNKKTVDATGFSVTTDKETYATTDTVRFSFSGNPSYLTFYSGEPYHRYEYSERVSAAGTPQLQFTSQVTTTSTQTNTLRLLVSTDFSGVYDSTNIYQATWTDITGKAVLGTNNTTATPSGIINLGDFVNNGQPVYLAFKFIGNAGSIQRQWTIKSIALANVQADNTSYSLLNITESTAGFKSVAMKAPAVAWAITNAQLQIKGGTVTASAEAEGWVISKPLVLNKVTPDTGTPLKNMTTFMSAYNYMYGTPGSYKATFVAANINRYDEKSNIIEVPITVQ